MVIILNIIILAILVFEIIGFYQVSALAKGNAAKRFALLLLFGIGIGMTSIFYFIYFNEKYVYLYFLTIGVTSIIMSIKWVSDKKNI